MARQERIRDGDVVTLGSLIIIIIIVIIIILIVIIIIIIIIIIMIIIIIAGYKGGHAMLAGESFKGDVFNELSLLVGGCVHAFMHACMVA